MEFDCLQLDYHLSPDFKVGDFFPYIDEEDLPGLMQHCNDTYAFINLTALSNAILQPILTSLAPNNSIRIIRGVCDSITGYFSNDIDIEKDYQHFVGQAVDIVFEKEAMRSLPRFLEDNHILFDQCYLEHIDEAGYPEEIHISYRCRGGNRREVIFNRR